MTRPWDDVDDDGLLDLLGTALAPPPLEREDALDGLLPATSDAPAVVVELAPALDRRRRRAWPAVAAIAAGAAVIAGIATAVADGDGGRGQVAAVPVTTPFDAAAGALDDLEEALSGPDDAALADAAATVRDRLDDLDVAARDALGPRPEELLAAAEVRLAPPAPPETSTTVPPPLPDPAVTTTTADDHGGDDDSGSDDSGSDDDPGSDDSSGRGSGSDDSGSDDDSSGSGSG